MKESSLFAGADPTDRIFRMMPAISAVLSLSFGALLAGSLFYGWLSVLLPATIGFVGFAVVGLLCRWIAGLMDRQLSAKRVQDKGC